MHSKQRLYNQNYKSVRVPALICGFVHAKQRLKTRITSLCWSKTSPVGLCMQNSVLTTIIASLYLCQTSSVDLCMQNSVLTTRIASLYVSQTSSVDLCKQNSFISTKISSLYVSVLIELNKAWVRALLALPSLIRLLPRPCLAQLRLGKANKAITQASLRASREVVAIMVVVQL